MSNFKEIIDYLKVFRRSEEAAAKETHLAAMVIDKDFISGQPPHEDDYIFVKKEDIYQQNSYVSVSEQMESETLYLQEQPDGELYYYTQKEVLVNNIPTNLFKRIPFYTTDEGWIPLDENTLIAKATEAIGNFYYDQVKGKIIEVSLESVHVFPDYFIYHPEALKADNGQYEFDYKDHEGNTASAYDRLFKLSKQLKTDRVHRKVIFQKSIQPCFVSLLPRIKVSHSGKYYLQYVRYEKGMSFNRALTESVLTLEFNYFGSLLKFLNATVFYGLDSMDAFNSKNREAFFDDYINLVDDLIYKAKNNEALEILYYIPAFFYSNLDLNFLWNLLDNTLDGNVTNFGLDTEDIVIDILEGLAESYENKNIFLSELINRKTKSKTSLLYRLFYKIDGDNFIALVKSLWTLWKESAFVFPDTETNPTYSNTNGSIFLPYRSKKEIGFYFTSLKVAEKSSTELSITYGTGKYETYLGKDAGGGTTTKSREITETVSYHPYYPIYLIKTDHQDFVFDDLKHETLVPAFVLYANELKTFWSNVVTTGEYTVDILTTLSGVGNIAKFRHLTKLNKLAQVAKGVDGVEKVVQASNILRYIKGAAGVVELSSGSLNILLKITDVRNESPYKELSEFLFYLELVTLAGELTAPLKVGLKKSAREAIEKSDGALRKQYNELFGELYKVANIDSNILLKNKEFVKHLEDLRYGKVARIYPNLLSLEEEAVLRFYTTNLGYKNFNKALRGEIKMTDEFLAQEQLMNQALDKLPNYKTDALLYRIENLSGAQIEEYYKVGEEVTNKHFTSSSYDINAIGKAMERRPYTLLIRIESKNGKMIENISTFQKEKEILFKSNTGFYVDDIRMTRSPEDFVTPIKTIILKEL